MWLNRLKPGERRIGRPVLFIRPLFILFLILSCGHPLIDWKTVIDTGTDENGVALLASGDTLIAVANQGKTGGVNAVILVQYLDRAGQMLRRQNVAEGRTCVARSACFDPKSNLFVGGYARPYDTTVALIVKINPAGRIVWKKGLALGSECWVNGVAAADTTVAVCGSLRSGDNLEPFVALLNTEGKTIWSKNYRLHLPAEATAIAIGPKGNLTVLARSACPGKSDVIILQLSPRGDTIWTRLYDSGGDDTPGGLALDPLGNIIATVTARLPDSVRLVILEYTPDGGVVRKVAYGENTQAVAAGVTSTAKGEIFITGTVLGQRHRAPLVFEYLPGATTIWERQPELNADADGVTSAVADAVFLMANVKNRTQDIAILKLNRPGTSR